MLGKKDEKLVDLEYMIPKEHKEESVIDTVEETNALREVCHTCGCTSDEKILMPIFHQGVDKWICPKCWKNEAEPSTVLYQPEPQETETQETDPEETSEGSGGFMSMFD
jgi:hypothetical protein